MAKTISIDSQQISLNELTKLLTESLTGPLSESIANRLSQDKSGKKKYVTRQDLCTQFDISLPTIDRLIKNGELKPYRIAGRRIVFLAEEVDQYVQAQRFA